MKRLLAVIAAAFLPVALAACGGKDTAAPGTLSPTVMSTTQAGETTPRPTVPVRASTPTPPATVAARPTFQAAAPGNLGTRSMTAHSVRAPDFEPLPGARASFGRLGDAAYRIEMPATWNGELVLYAHGVRLGTTELTVSNPNGPLRQHFVNGGFAWAASSYSENGYVPGIGADDTLAVLDEFTRQFGRPKRVYLVGESMGGNVVALLQEHRADRFDGALAVCGALGGIEEIDFILSWAMVAEFASGVPIPVGGTASQVTSALLSGVSPALGTPARPTERGRQFISIVRELTGGARPFYLEGLQEQYQANFSLLLQDPARLTLAGAAATNEGTTYGIADGLGLTASQVNAGIRRLPADVAARDAVRHPDAVPTTGRIGKPFLSLHNTGDLFVPITMQTAYLAKVKAAGKQDLLVQRAIRDAGHCKFSEQEYRQAFDDLVAWVRDGRKPAGDDLSGSLADVGRAFTTPLRANDPGTP